MKVFYDNEVDALYLELGEGRSEGVSELSEGVNLDITANGKLVGIEILNASSKMDIQTIWTYQLDLDESLLAKAAG